jgi:hypothetical protein
MVRGSDMRFEAFDSTDEHCLTAKYEPYRTTGSASNPNGFPNMGVRGVFFDFRENGPITFHQFPGRDSAMVWQAFCEAELILVFSFGGIGLGTTPNFP